MPVYTRPNGLDYTEDVKDAQPVVNDTAESDTTPMAETPIVTEPTVTKEPTKPIKPTEPTKTKSTSPIPPPKKSNKTKAKKLWPAESDDILGVEAMVDSEVSSSPKSKETYLKANETVRSANNYSPDKNPIYVNSNDLLKKDVKWWDNTGVNSTEEVVNKLDKKINQGSAKKDFVVGPMTVLDPNEPLKINIKSNKTGESLDYAWAIDKSNTLNDFLYTNGRYNKNKNDQRAYKATGISRTEALAMYDDHALSLGDLAKNTLSGAFNAITNNSAKALSDFTSVATELINNEPDQKTRDERVDFVRGVAAGVKQDAATVVNNEIKTNPIFKEKSIGNIINDDEFYNELVEKNSGFIYKTGLKPDTVKNYFKDALLKTYNTKKQNWEAEINKTLQGKPIDETLNFYKSKASKTLGKEDNKIYQSVQQIESLQAGLYKIQSDPKYNINDPEVAKKVSNLNLQIINAKNASKGLSAEGSSDNSYLLDISTNKIATVDNKDVDLNNKSATDVTDMVSLYSKMYKGTSRGTLAKKFVEINSLNDSNIAFGNKTKTVLIPKNIASDSEKVFTYQGYKTKRDVNGDLIVYDVPVKKLAGITNQSEFSNRSYFDKMGTYDVYDYSNGKKGSKIDSEIDEYSKRATDLGAQSIAVNKLYLLNQSPTKEVPNILGASADAFAKAVYGGYKTSREKSMEMKDVLDTSGIKLRKKSKEELTPGFAEGVATNTASMLPTVAKIVAVTALTEGIGTYAVGAEAIAAFNALKTGSAASKAAFHVLSAIREEAVMQMAGLEKGSGIGFYVPGAILPRVFRPFENSWLKNNLSQFAYNAAKGGGQMEVAGMVEHAWKTVNSDKKFQDYLDENYSDLGEVAKRVIGNSLSFGVLEAKEFATDHFFKSGKLLESTLAKCTEKSLFAKQAIVDFKEKNSPSDKNYKTDLGQLQEVYDTSLVAHNSVSDAYFSYRYNKLLDTPEGMQTVIDKENESIINSYKKEYGQDLKITVFKGEGENRFVEPKIDPKTKQPINQGEIFINYDNVYKNGIFNRGVVAHEINHFVDYAEIQKKTQEYRDSKIENADGELVSPTTNQVNAYKDRLGADKNKKIVDVLKNNFPELFESKIYSIENEETGKATAYNLIEAVTKKYSKVDEKGRVINKAEVNDEIVKRVIEELGKGTTLVNPVNSRNIFKRVSKDFLDVIGKGKDIDYKIKNADQLINLLSDYASSFKKGKPSYSHSKALAKIDLSDFLGLEPTVQELDNPILIKKYDEIKRQQDLDLKNFEEYKRTKESKSIDDRIDDLYDKLNAREIEEDAFEIELAKLEKEEQSQKDNFLNKKVSETPKAETLKEPTGEDIVKEEKENAKIIENNRGTVASARVQEIYNEKGLAGAFEIIKEFKAITGKLVDKRRDAPGFDKQLLTDELETGSGGLYDLIRTYDPSKGVPLAAHINGNYALRAIAASKRILQKEFSKEIMDDSGSPAYDMADDYSYDTTLDEMRVEEDRQSNLINPIDMMGAELSTEYNSLVKEKVDAMTPAELNGLTFAKLNDLAPEVTAKFFGTTVRKVTDAKANLATPEIPVIQKIIYDNRTKLIKLLPEGAILEGTPASDILIGTGLSIPRKLQQLFYDQKERLGKGAGLIPFELKKNITQEDFLNAFGINKDGSFEPFGGQDPRAQTMLAMVRLYGKIASNTAVRMEAAQTLEQAADLKAGASKVQYGLDINSNALDHISVASNEELKQANKNNLYNKGLFNAMLKDAGFNEFNPFVNKALGSQNFNYPELKKYVEKRNEFIRTLPVEITMDRGLLYGLLGKHYRTDGTGYDFLKNTYKKLVDNNKISVEDAVKMQVNDSLKAASLNSNLAKNNSDLNLSSKTKELISQLNIAKQELSGLTINGKKITEYTTLTKQKLDVLKNLLADKKIDSNEFEKILNEYSQLDKVNKLKAELFINSLKEWNNEEGISKQEKESRLHTTANMLLANSNIVKGLRSLSRLNGVVIDISKKAKGKESTKYVVEHETAISDIIKNIFKDIIDNKDNIEFNSTSKLVPEDLAKARNDNAGMKVSSVDVYTTWLGGVLSKLKNKYEPVFLEKSKSLDSAYLKEQKIKESKDLSDNFNIILEETKGINRGEQFSDITARTIGAGKGKFRVFMSPSAEDFSGLLYDFMGKGKRGEEQQKFFEDNLLKPYAKGVTRIDNVRANIKEGYRGLKKEHPVEADKLTKVIKGTTNTYDQAVRAYLWDTHGVEIPGLSKDEVSRLVDVVKADTELMDFANKLSIASGQLEGWIKPSEYWNVESIVSDLHNITEGIGRQQILGEFVTNADAIFSPENLNKIEAARGSDFRSALEDSLFRMKNGTNRSSGDNIGGKWASWVNNSSGAIMFLNTRSAVLQLVASTNYLNWTDNNPIRAAATFANQPQYWKDFAELWNSNSLKERRAGLKSDVDQAELANAVKGSKNKAKAALAYLLKVGYTPTQMADSFAICSGGATFYRNRIWTYKEQGMSESEAKDKAFQDFLATSEESQQSADPSKISQQQASSIGRIILAFGNTPMQYNRLMKKAGRDLINGRGDAKTHISKILYYGAVQNMIFSSLQSALFAMAFDKEPEDDKEKKTAEEKKKDKYLSVANSMLDTVIRGTGVYGAIVTTIKNTVLEYLKQEKKGFKGDQTKTILAATSLSPPISSKLTKLYSAINTREFEKDVIEKRGWDLMENGQFNPSPSYKVAGKLTAAVTNFPLDRLVDKADNVAEILDKRNQTWQKVALGLGWKPFDVGVRDEEEDIMKTEAKTTRKFESGVSQIEDRMAKKEALANRLDKMTDKQMDTYVDSLTNAKEKAAARKMMIWERVEKDKNK